MSLREMRRAVKAREWVFRGGEEGCKLKGLSKFQTKRRAQAMTLAKAYLTGDVPTKGIGYALGVSAERAAQVIRLGIAQLKRQGALRRAVGVVGTKKDGRKRRTPA